jgi:ABC-type multidrug transport system ATPase subunit
VKRGECLGLLGHNGAGKTTLISLLVGRHGADRDGGSAFVDGLPIDLEMDEIQRRIGVCSQHDTLWPALTAEEHLTLFCRLRGLWGAALRAEVAALLDAVELTSVARKRTGTFSGGMQRRLSVAIAAVGKPAVLFLDEPTTGMDPVNRRSAWRMIERMKRRGENGGCAIVLTTHSMAEAERLSDRIAIMGNGKIIALGNALHLKARFGAGYRVSIVSNDVAALRATALQRIVELTRGMVKEVACDAGSLVVSVPRSASDSMAAVLRILEAEAAASAAYADGSAEQVVCEWSLSHATLEEVFLRLTDSSHFMKMGELSGVEEATGGDDGVVAGASADDVALLVLSDAVPAERTVWQRIVASHATCARASQALASKNVTLQRRRSGELLCQITTRAYALSRSHTRAQPHSCCSRPLARSCSLSLRFIFPRPLVSQQFSSSL